MVCRQTNTDLRMLFDRSKGVMYELNETASAVVSQLDQRAMTVAEIAQALSEEFDAPVDAISADVEVMLADFTSAGLTVLDLQEAGDHAGHDA